jgi:hypothetical protein
MLVGVEGAKDVAIDSWSAVWSCVRLQGKVGNIIFDVFIGIITIICVVMLGKYKIKDVGIPIFAPTKTSYSTLVGFI